MRDFEINIMEMFLFFKFIIELIIKSSVGQNIIFKIKVIFI